MPLYDPSGHGLLSAAAARLEAPVLAEHAELAEDLLGLGGTAFAGADAGAATRAVALQVSHQVEIGIDAFVLSSSGRGARSKSYRDGDITVSPLAKRIVDRLIPPATSGTWAPVGSLR